MRQGDTQGAYTGLRWVGSGAHTRATTEPDEGTETRGGAARPQGSRSIPWDEIVRPVVETPVLQGRSLRRALGVVALASLVTAPLSCAARAVVRPALTPGPALRCDRDTLLRPKSLGALLADGTPLFHFHGGIVSIDRATGTYRYELPEGSWAHLVQLRNGSVFAVVPGDPRATGAQVLYRRGAERWEPWLEIPHDHRVLPLVDAVGVLKEGELRIVGDGPSAAIPFVSSTGRAKGTPIVSSDGRWLLQVPIDPWPEDVWLEGPRGTSPQSAVTSIDLRTGAAAPLPLDLRPDQFHFTAVSADEAGCFLLAREDRDHVYSPVRATLVRLCPPNMALVPVADLPKTDAWVNAVEQVVERGPVLVFRGRACPTDWCRVPVGGSTIEPAGPIADADWGIDVCDAQFVEWNGLTFVREQYLGYRTHALVPGRGVR